MRLKLTTQPELVITHRTNNLTSTIVFLSLLKFPNDIKSIILQFTIYNF